MSATDDIVIVHPQTGEAFDRHAIDAMDTTALADLLFSLRVEKAKWTEQEKEVRGVVRDRIEATGHKKTQIGPWWLENNSGRSRKWDPDDLEATLNDLVTDGVIEAGAWTGLVTTVPKVDGNMARDLLGVLDGDARKAVEACYSWEKGSPSVKVEPVQDEPEEVRAA